MLNIENLSGRLARWKLQLQEFHYEVIYRRGIKLLARDGLSQLDTDGHNECELADGIPVIALTKADEKTLDTFNEDDAISKQPTTYPNNVQQDDLISR